MIKSTLADYMNPTFNDVPKPTQSRTKASLLATIVSGTPFTDKERLNRLLKNHTYRQLYNGVALLKKTDYSLQTKYLLLKIFEY